MPKSETARVVTEHTDGAETDSVRFLPFARSA